MLKNLLTSKVRIDLIRTFIENTESEFYIRELTRNLDQQINAIRRELENLKSINFLTCKEKNRKKYYSLNKKFLLLNEIKGFVCKTNPDVIKLYTHLNKVKEIQKLTLTGSFIQRQDPIDILVVSELDSNNIINAIDNLIQVPAKIAVLTPEDYKYRKSVNDKFLSQIEEIPDKLEIISKIDL